MNDTTHDSCENLAEAIDNLISTFDTPNGRIKTLIFDFLNHLDYQNGFYGWAIGNADGPAPTFTDLEPAIDDLKAKRSLSEDRVHELLGQFIDDKDLQNKFYAYAYEIEDEHDVAVAVKAANATD